MSTASATQPAALPAPAAARRSHAGIPPIAGARPSRTTMPLSEAAGEDCLCLACLRKAAADANVPRMRRTAFALRRDTPFSDSR
jgi:hypothetical protein